MKVLLVGNGAREHAICEALSRSKHKPEIINFATARNPGIAKLAAKVEVGDILDAARLKAIAEAEKPDFAVIGPDDPIGNGAADTLMEQGIPSVAPFRTLARIESSKSYARNLLKKYDIPGNPKHKVFFDEMGMEDYAKECGEFVVKFDGLMGGKGVQVMGDHFSTAEEGLAIAKDYLQQSGKVLIEEKLQGQEFSLLFFVDGASVVPMPVVQDNKRAFAEDKGPNTGGMGSISDFDHLLPFISKEDVAAAKDIAVKTIGALQAEANAPYKGILFGGFMAAKDGVRLIEFNARFGDPEALNLLPLLATDFVEVCQAIINGTLGELSIEFLEQATVCKYIVPEGYPTDPKKDVAIQIDPVKIPDEAKLYYASVDSTDKGLILKGSRAIAVVGIADSMAEAQYLAEEATKAVTGPVFHREDIGTTRQVAERVAMMKLLRGL